MNGVSVGLQKHYRWITKEEQIQRWERINSIVDYHSQYNYSQPHRDDQNEQHNDHIYKWQRGKNYDSVQWQLRRGRLITHSLQTLPLLEEEPPSLFRRDAFSTSTSPSISTQYPGEWRLVTSNKITSKRKYTIASRIVELWTLRFWISRITINEINITSNILKKSKLGTNHTNPEKTLLITLFWYLRDFFIVSE